MVWLMILFLACETSSTEVTEQEPVDLRPKVRTTVVAQQRFSNSLKLPTTIQAIQSAVLVPRVPGRVEKVMVRIGDLVAENDLLMTLEGGDYLAGFQEAKAAKELAQIQSDQASIHLARFQNLRKDGAITEVQLEEAEINARLAEGQAKRAAAGFEVAKNRLVDTELRAPFAGTIVARNVEAGEMMGGPVQRPPLMLADLSKIRFVAEVGERDVAGIEKGMKARLIIAEMDPLDVTIERVNQAVDPIVNTVQIEGLLSNNSQLRHGQSAELAIELRDRTQIALARSALLDRNDGQGTVFVLRADNTIEAKQVSYGRSDSGQVPILRGLEAGEKVLISGHTRLKSGDIVVDIGQE